MGLDMMLYRCSKPSYSENTDYFGKENVDHNMNIMYCTTFKNFVELTTKKNKYWDFEKINNTFGVKVKYQSVNCSEGIGFSCEGIVPKENIIPEEYRRENLLFIKQKDVNDFIYEKDDEMYAIDLNEIAYQRKGLNDIGWSLLPENCSYTDNKVRIKEMTSNGGLSIDFMNKWIDGETVFHPWW